MLRLALCDDDREYLKLVEGKIKDYCRMRHREIMLECFSDSDLLATAIDSGHRNAGLFGSRIGRNDSGTL